MLQTTEFQRYGNCETVSHFTNHEQAQFGHLNYPPNSSQFEKSRTFGAFPQRKQIAI
jgi:hypothetical protein